MKDKEEGYSQEEVEEMTEMMIEGAFPDFTKEQVEEIARETGKQFMEELK